MQGTGYDDDDAFIDNNNGEVRNMPNIATDSRSASIDHFI